MRYLFWACLLCLIPGLLIRIPFGGGGILLSDFLAPLFALVWFAQKVLIERSLPSFRFIAPAMAFTFVALISWVWGAWDLLLKEQVLTFSYIVRFISIVFLGWYMLDQTKSNVDKTLLNLFKIVGVVVLLGYLQFYVYPDISKFSTVGGFDPHIGRLLGTWMDPNFVGGLIAFMTPLMLGYWYQTDNKKIKYWLGAIILLSIYALFLTFSRSAYLAAVGGLFIFFLLRDPKVILVGVLLASLGLASSERAQQRVGELAGTMASVVLRDTDEVDATAKLRVQSWQRSLILFDKYPVIGIGYNTYRFRGAEEGVVDENFFSAGGSDSTLLTVLVTTGIIGFLAFMWFYADLWIRNFIRWRKAPRRNSFLSGGELNLGFVAGWSAILVHSVFVNSLLFPLIFIPIMVVAGALERQSKKEN
ncbi:O-antigen ligase family protein [bacterium]|nr:O-antigen ligase family protein [bacterium]NCQ55094.1 O-antigen ligase family protein [Candidatus Parcubacteria bacterium]NCS67138.1 O-antigen ligase family protein [Candidatus Peregrinibacteria bacterium]NCS96084.1 O-antigen ligase family protein [bacterium]